MIYNWQQPDWPDFKYDLTGIEDIMFSFAEEMGRVSGILNALSKDSQSDTLVNMMVSEAIKTSEIEGEYLNRQDVVSSIRNNLGLNRKPANVHDKRAHGIGSLMVDVRQTYREHLSKEKLFSWHKMLMEGSRGVQIGKWRSHKEPMQVISGAAGKEKIHFEAPPSRQVPSEMDRFIDWFNETAPGSKKQIKNALVRSAIAHLYFESIHPFEDGNGRIGRAVAEKALSQTLKRPVLLSLSKTIEANKRQYYSALEKGQRSNHISPWIKYFTETTLLAQKQARQLIDFTLKKAKFFDHFKDQFNERQLKVVKRMFDAGPEGFEGGMRAAKYMILAKTTKATATRDLQHLSEIKALIMEGGGRSTRYVLNLRDDH